MPASTPQIPTMSDAPLPASRPPRGEPLRGRLPTSGRVHRRDPETGAWVEVDEQPQLADMDVASDDDEFSAIEQDARSQIAEEEATLRRLARAALTDPKIAAECADSESRRRSAQQVLERAGIAREETARCATEEVAAAQEKKRRLAQAAADKIAGQRHKEAQEVDRLARELARRMQRCEALSVELDLKLQEAGGRPGDGMFGPHAYENALRAALGSAGVRPGLIAFEGPASGRVEPLAGVEPEAH